MKVSCCLKKPLAIVDVKVFFSSLPCSPWSICSHQLLVSHFPFICLSHIFPVNQASLHPQGTIITPLATPCRDFRVLCSSSSSFVLTIMWVTVPSTFPTNPLQSKLVTNSGTILCTAVIMLEEYFRMETNTRVFDGTSLRLLYRSETDTPPYTKLKY